MTTIGNLHNFISPFKHLSSLHSLHKFTLLGCLMLFSATLIIENRFPCYSTDSISVSQRPNAVFTLWVLPTQYHKWNQTGLKNPVTSEKRAITSSADLLTESKIYQVVKGGNSTFIKNSAPRSKNCRRDTRKHKGTDGDLNSRAVLGRNS